MSQACDSLLISHPLQHRYSRSRSRSQSHITAPLLSASQCRRQTRLWRMCRLSHGAATTASQVSPPSPRSPHNLRDRQDNHHRQALLCLALPRYRPPKSQHGMPFDDFVIENDELHDYESQSPSHVVWILASCRLDHLVRRNSRRHHPLPGLPLIEFGHLANSKKDGFNLGGTNASGQVPNLANMRTFFIDQIPAGVAHREIRRRHARPPAGL